MFHRRHWDVDITYSYMRGIVVLNRLFCYREVFAGHCCVSEICARRMISRASPVGRRSVPEIVVFNGSLENFVFVVQD